MFQLNVVVTEKCNLACKYCYMHNNPVNMSYEVADGIISKLNDLINSLNIFNFNRAKIVYFGGEPLINLDIIKYIHSKVKNNPLVDGELIISNLLLLNNQTLNYLSQENIPVSWSFDGLWNENNRVLVNGNSSLAEYEKKIDLIKLVNTSPKTMISPASVDTIIDNFEYMYYHLGIIPKFALVRDDIWSKNDIDKFRNIMDKLIDRYVYLIKNDEKFKDMIPDIDLFTLPIMDCIVNKQYGKRPFSCFAGSGGCAVMPNGDIYPCGRFGSNKLFKYGNVLEELNKEEIQKINKNVYINPVEIKECKSCKLYKYCNAGCTYSQIKNNYKPLESICELYHIVYDKAFKWYNILKENNVAIDRRIKTALQNIG